MIYLIKCKATNTCKIGYSNNPKARLAQLQTGNPFSLELVSVIKGDLSLEKKLHKRFEEYKLSGEWFEYSKKVKEYFKVEEYFTLSKSLLNLFMTLNSNEIKVLSYMIKELSNNHQINLSKQVRLKISKILKISEKTILRALVSLLKKEVIVSIQENVFSVNKKYLK